MKRFIMLIFVSTLFLPLASAQVMRQMDVTFDIENDKSVNVVMFFKFSDEIKRINIPFSGGISNIVTENGECKVVVNVQQILQCEPPSPFVVGDWALTTRFRLDGAVERQGNISGFSFDVPVLWETEKMSTTIRLPIGYVVSQNVVLPTSPSGAFVSLEGAKVTARWNFENVEAGNIIPLRVYYEAIGPIPSVFERIDPLILLTMVVLLGVGVVLIGMIYLRVAKRKKVVLSVLNENERLIINILQSKTEENVDQRRIVEESGFSKAKVSRIIQSLKERGLVETERIGRKNRVKLKKKLLEE